MKVFSTSWLPVGGRFGFLVGLLLATGLNVAPAFAQAPNLNAVSPARNATYALPAASPVSGFDTNRNSRAGTLDSRKVSPQQRGGQMSGAQSGAVRTTIPAGGALGGGSQMQNGAENKKILSGGSVTTNLAEDSTGGGVTGTGSSTPPALTSLPPSSGVVGTSVTLTGTNFTRATGVSFNGTAATTFAVTNATTATATVPTNATSGNVTITTPAGTSNGVAFTLCAPQAIAKPATVQLVANGTVSLTAATVNNGSTANCGFAAGGGLSVTPSSFTCANLGPNTVTLTVTDFFGNTNSATVTITVVGSIPVAAITVVPRNTVNTGGVPTNLYLGYGPQSITLLASAGGTRYAWTGPAGLSSTSTLDPVFTATTAGSFTFTVVITNRFGCTATASVTLTVRDVRCDIEKGKNKVVVCHNGSALCINASDVADHLGHGDRLGACPLPGARPLAVTQAAVVPRLAPQLEAYPNPARDAVRVRVVHAAPAGPLQLFDALGRLVHAQPAPAPGAEALLPLTGRPSGL